MQRDMSLQTDFSAGELSPRLNGRFDLEVYSRGASLLRNFITMRQGGITKAPGSVYIRDVISNTKISYLVPIQMAPGKNYILEFSHQFLSVFIDGVRVAHSISHIIEEADVRKIQWVRIKKDIYVSCEGYRPQKFTWDGTDGGWTKSEPTFTGVLFHQTANHPRGIAFMENRLIFIGTTDNPQTVYGSKVGAYEDFTGIAESDDSWAFTIASGENETLRWGVGREVLLIGTEQGEHILTGRGNGITPTTVYSTKQTPFGSEPVAGMLADEAIIFVQRGGRIVREYYYRDERQSYTSPDLNMMSEHIFDSKIIQMSHQRLPDSVVWFVTESGKLVGMTYDHHNQIIGFHIHETDGVYESVACVPEVSEDRIYVVVKRTIDGAEKRYIEWFSPRYQPDVRSANFTHSAKIVDMGSEKAVTLITKADPAVVTCVAHGFSNGDKIMLRDIGGMIELSGEVFTVAGVATNTFTLRDITDSGGVDSTGFSTYTSGGVAFGVTATVTGLGHLEEKEVSILADARIHSTRTVESGNILLDAWYNKVVVGLRYTSKARLMKIGMHHLKRISKVFVNLDETVSCAVGPDEENLTEIVFRASDQDLTRPTPKFSGFKEIPFQGRYDRDGYVMIVQSDPSPITVLSVASEIVLYTGE